MAFRFTHITFTVSNFARSIAFYRDVCQMKVVRDRRLEGGSTVWLGPPSTPDDPAQGWPVYIFVLEEGTVTDRLNHLSFQCDDRSELDKIAARAQADGILDEGPVHTNGSIGSYVIIRDPDGHLVEFTYGQPIVGVM